jgi:hypothetical protein
MALNLTSEYLLKTKKEKSEIKERHFYKILASVIIHIQSFMTCAWVFKCENKMLILGIGIYITNKVMMKN